MVLSGRLCLIHCRAWSPDGCEFVIAFDNGNSSEFNTLLVTDWIAHTPPDVLAKMFGVPAEAFKNIPLHQPMDLPNEHRRRPPLDAVEAQMAAVDGAAGSVRVEARRYGAESGRHKSGTVRIADSTNFVVSKTVPASRSDKPGGVREMHFASQCR